MKLTKEQKEYIVFLYSIGDYTFTDIAKKYNKPISSIKYLLNSRGYTAKSKSELSRKYNIDSTFFSDLDSAEKAYFLGWVYSDGSIIIKYNSLRISLKEDDRDVLEVLKNLIKSEKPLKKINVDKKRKGFENSKDQFLLEITNKDIVENLISIGLIENKSANISFPNLPDELYPYFIRGYFEGDGWFTDTDKTKQLGFIGSDEFIKTLQEILHSYNIKMNINKKGKMSTLTCGGHSNKNYKLFFNIIYKDKIELSLKRKYSKLFKFISK